MLTVDWGGDVGIGPLHRGSRATPSKRVGTRALRVHLPAGLTREPPRALPRLIKIWPFPSVLMVRPFPEVIK